MATFRIRRQVLLFLLGVLIPGAVLLAFGLMLVRQETELSKRRDADALSIRARTLSDSLGAWLDEGYTATGDSLLAGGEQRYPANNRMLFVGSYANGAYMDASSHTARPHPLAQSAHVTFVRAVERQEFADGDRSGAIPSLRRRLGAESDSTRTTDLRVRLARALFAANQSTRAASQARLALRHGPEVQDEFGTPLPLYAADLLMDDERTDEVCERLSGLAGTRRWLTGGAARYLSDLTERAGCPANTGLEGLLDETRVAGQVAALGERLVADRTSERWLVLGATWLMRRVDGDRREAEPVVAIRLSDVDEWLVVAGVDSLSVARLADPLKARANAGPVIPHAQGDVPPGPSASRQPTNPLHVGHRPRIGDDCGRRVPALARPAAGGPPVEPPAPVSRLCIARAQDASHVHSALLGDHARIRLGRPRTTGEGPARHCPREWPADAHAQQCVEHDSRGSGHDDLRACAR